MNAGHQGAECERSLIMPQGTKSNQEVSSFCHRGKKSISYFTGSNPSQWEDNVRAPVMTTPPAPPWVIIGKGQQYGVFYNHVLFQGSYTY